MSKGREPEKENTNQQEEADEPSTRKKRAEMESEKRKPNRTESKKSIVHGNQGDKSTTEGKSRNMGSPQIPKKEEMLKKKKVQDRKTPWSQRRRGKANTSRKRPTGKKQEGPYDYRRLSQHDRENPGSEAPK